MAVLSIGLVSLMAALQVAAESDKPEVRVPGMQAQRVEDSVFGGRAYIYQAGQEHARTIVLVHGVGDQGVRDFREQIPWLAESFHVIAFDLPGFGQSDKANVLYSPANYAAFVKVVTDRFAHRPFVLVGHSMGGVVALRYAALYPVDVERLVVSDTPGILYRYAYSSHYLSRLGVDFLPSVVDPLSKLANLARKILGSLERSKFDPELILSTRTLRDSVLGADPSKIAGLAVAIDNLSKVLPKITAQTLVVWGKQDTLAPLRTGSVLAHMLTRAQLVVIDRAEHVPMLEAPERFRAALERFLAKGVVEAPRAAPMEKHGDGRCEKKRSMIYEGDYDSLTLIDCSGSVVRNARVRQLRVEDSNVKIEDSDIGGGDVGLLVRGSTVEMTVGRIWGEVAIRAFGSRLDLAAVEVEGGKAAMQAPQSSTVSFSISRVRSPYNSGSMHGFYAVEDGKPL